MQFTIIFIDNDFFYRGSVAFDGALPLLEISITIVIIYHLKLGVGDPCASHINVVATPEGMAKF